MEDGKNIPINTDPIQIPVLSETMEKKESAQPKAEVPQKETEANAEKPNGVKEESSGKRYRYRVQYLSKENELLSDRVTSVADFNEENELRAGQDTVFEIVKTFKLSREANKKGNDEDVPLTATPPQRSMRILSRAVAHAIRSVVTFYPSQDLASDIIDVPYPYPVLVHHYDELLEYREGANPTSTKERCPRQGKSMYDDLGVLLDYLDESIMPAVREEKERNKLGLTTFDWYWIAYKPGQTILRSRAVSGEWEARVVYSLTGGSFEFPRTPWIVHHWRMNYFGNYIDRSRDSTLLEKWDGEAYVHGTKVVDIEATPRDSDVEEIVKRGKIYWDLLEKQCRWFNGKTSDFPHEEVEGLVMVDIDDYYSTYPEKREDTTTIIREKRTCISDCRCPVCYRRMSEVDIDSDPLFETLYRKTSWGLKDVQFFLLPQSIWAYVFKTRTWAFLPVDGFSDPHFDEDMISNLVMDSKRLAIIKALAKNYARIDQHGDKLDSELWSADFVKGKGTGLSFLLHGSPGTGKTCTAECIAAYTRRPLMALTTRDIGVSPDDVEKNLIKHFRRAKSWGAVLLIDEADVFLQRRSTTDLTRNSLVAGFLRALEWYEGILFLTTNRVGTFDDAFISRIHFKFYYPDFDDKSRRKVWETFIVKLSKERGDSIRLNIDAKEYLDGKELKAVKWNGREIRNAFQSAVSLAEYEGKKDVEGKILLTDDHLRSVVEMSRDFKEYINHIHHGDEGRRAQLRYERVEALEE